MRFSPNTVYHIYNRGNNKKRIFFSEHNYLFFIQKISKHIRPQCEILTWCLMPNHFHILVYATDKSCSENYGTSKLRIQALTYWIGIVQSSNAQAINKQNGTTGSLFQCKTKAKEIYESENIARCLRYIHQNPLKANMVDKMEDWEFSSFKDYAGLRNGTLCNQELLFNLTNSNTALIQENSESAIEMTDLFY